MEKYGYNIIECFTQNFNSNQNIYELLTTNSIQPYKLCIMPINSMNVTPFKASGIHHWMESLGQLVRFERLMIVRECQSLYNLEAVDLQYIQAALTHKSINSESNYEVFETIGDAALKLIASLYLYLRHSAYNEAELSKTRERIIKNDALGDLGRAHSLQFFIQSDNKKLKYLTMPGFELNQNVIQRKVFLTANNLGKKVVPDAVESLIGAGLIQTGSLFYCLHVIYRFDVLREFNFENFEATFTTSLKIKDKYYDYLHRKQGHIDTDITVKSLFRFMDKVDRAKGRKRRVIKELNISDLIHKLKVNTDDFDQIQQKQQKIRNLLLLEHQRHNLGYVFKNKKLLNHALSIDTKEFQRLEFFGDAVIEIYALYNMFLLQKKYGFESAPATLHGLKVALLSTFPLAKLTYLLGHYKYLRIPIDESYKRMVENIGKDTKYKNLWADSALNNTKVLGDAFEALIGALYMDGSWTAVRKVLDPVFLPFIYYFAKNCENMVTDMKHIVIDYYNSKGMKINIDFDAQNKKCRLLVGIGQTVAYEVDCENKRAGEVKLWSWVIENISKNASQA